MIFFTSDTHFGHKNIIDFCDRPFKNVDHMNWEIMKRWNNLVMPDDTVYHLGDVALGNLEKSLYVVKGLNGHKILVPGNHDRIFSTNAPAYRERFLRQYEEVFEEIYDEQQLLQLTEDLQVRLSHLPYVGDPHDEDRFKAQRPVDDGRILVHGHTHGKEQVTRTKAGTLQLHVGMDAWDYTPVPVSKVILLCNLNEFGETG